MFSRKDDGKEAAMDWKALSTRSRSLLTVVKWS